MDDARTPTGGATGDEVDVLVAAWRRERPDLPLDAMQVWSRIVRLALHLDVARRRAHAAHQLEGWEFDVLAALRRDGAPYTMTPGALIKQTHVTSGTMTNRVDRLVARGLVERHADPSDRRVVRVVLTDAGREVVDAAFADLLAAEQSLLAGMDEEQQAGLVDALRRLLAAQEETTADAG